LVLVTGATGHVGNVLSRELVSRGEKVRAMALPGEDTSIIEAPGLEIVRGDIRDRDFVVEACRNIDIVYHLAALISIMPTMRKLVRSVNIEGTKNVIHACKVQRVRRLVYTSSIHAFAEPETGGIIDESIPFNPVLTAGVYGKSKAEAVLNVLTAAREGMDAVVICPTGIIGPYDYRLSEIGKMIKLFAAGKIRVAIEGSFDFVDVRDVALGEIEAAQRARPGEVYILGGQKVNMRELMNMLHELTGKKRVRTFLRSSPAYFLSVLATVYYVVTGKRAHFTPYTVHTLTRDYTYSHEKATRNLGYAPRSILESLRDTVSWLKRNDTTRLFLER